MENLINKIEHFIKNLKTTSILGFALFSVSAIFSISLLLVFFDFGGGSSAHNSGLYNFGKMISGAYGISSLFIPIFFLISALQMIGTEWKMKNGFLLACSIFPFFTLVLMERLCRHFMKVSVGGVLGIEIFSTVLFGILLFIGEFIVFSILADLVQERFSDDGVLNFEKYKYEYKSGRKMYEEDEESEDNSQNNEDKENVESKNDTISSENSVQSKVQEVYLNDVLENATEIDDKKSTSKIDGFVDISIGERILDFVKNDVKPLQLNEMLENATSIEDDDFESTDENNTNDENVVSNEKIFISNEDAFVQDENDELNSENNDVVQNDIVSDLDSEAIYEDNRFSKIFDAVENNEEIEIPTLSQVLSPSLAEPKLDISDEKEIVQSESAITSENDDVQSEDDFDENEKPIATSFMSSDVFSLMDDDAAENPVLKEDVDEYTEKLLEKKMERPALITKTEPILSEYDDYSDNENYDEENYDDDFKDDIQNEKVPFESIEREAQEALEKAEQETYTEQVLTEENCDNADFVFDPTARPVVDSNGKVIEYDDELDSEIKAYQNALQEDDEYFDDESDVSNEEDDFENDDDFDNEENEVIDPYKSSNPRTFIESKPYRKGEYKIPFDLLEDYPGNDYWVIDEETKLSGAKLKSTLSEFKIDVEITGIRKGPAVTMYELLPAPGVKLSKIESLQDNIALDLAASSVRIVAPIPGKHAVGIEVPNKKRAIVGFKELIEKDMSDFEKMSIPVVLGKDISGDPQMIDLAKTPHLLIAGSTGAGKSVCVNTMLLSILYKRSPKDVKLVLVDPKVVEMKLYNDIPHLLTPVITEAKRALQALQYCLCEMERRYALLANMNVREIRAYNKKIEAEHIATEKLPYIVVIIDEFADLMMTTGKELETVIARLAAKSRAIGIHLVLATQRPSTDVITGIIKANLPSRIAFMVASQMDSRVILDKSGAENLLGKGDMLYIGTSSPFPVRIQGTLVGDDEVERVVEYVKSYGEPEYIDEEMFVDEEDEDDDNSMFSEEGDDPLYDQALQIVVQAGKASASYIQRRLKIGYNRAARLVEEMEERGIVGPANGSKPREIIRMP